SKSLGLPQAAVQAVGAGTEEDEAKKRDPDLNRVTHLEEGGTARQVLQGCDQHREGHRRAREAGEEAEDEEDASTELRHRRREAPQRGREVDAQGRHGLADRLPSLRPAKKLGKPMREDEHGAEAQADDEETDVDASLPGHWMNLSGWAISQPLDLLKATMTAKLAA